jgi:hypothetical protein
MSLANPTAILAEGDIEHPARGIFDPPVTTGRVKSFLD